MPVLPLVGSSSSRPGRSSPDASAASIIAFATRSLIEPVGFWPSSFAYRRTDAFGVSRLSSTRGVLPTRSRRLGTTTLLRTAGHGREQDHRRAERDRGLEPVERAHVFALDVDVHERRDVVVLHELRAQAREARHQVVEQLANGVAVGGNLALSARLRAQRWRNADRRHAGVGLPTVYGRAPAAWPPVLPAEQNST